MRSSRARTRSRATSTRPASTSSSPTRTSSGSAQDGPLDRDRAVHQGRGRRQRPLREERLLHRARQDRPQGVLPAQVGPRGRGLTAICEVVIKDHEALAAIDPFSNTMLMTTLRWPDESARPATRPARGRVDFKRRIAIAERLISTMNQRLPPRGLQGRYREALEGIVGAKVDQPRNDQGRGARDPGRADRPHGRARGVRRAPPRRHARNRVSQCPRPRRPHAKTRGEGQEEQARDSPRRPRRRRHTRTRQPRPLDRHAASTDPRKLRGLREFLPDTHPTRGSRAYRSKSAGS